VTYPQEHLRCNCELKKSSSVPFLSNPVTSDISLSQCRLVVNYKTCRLLRLGGPSLIIMIFLYYCLLNFFVSFHCHHYQLVYFEIVILIPHLTLALDYILQLSLSLYPQRDNKSKHLRYSYQFYQNDLDINLIACLRCEHCLSFNRYPTKTGFLTK
jgi:hypothetical protein